MAHTLNRTLDDTFLKRWLCQTVADTLSRRAKRLIYVASVLGVVIQNRAPDPDLVDPLNKELKLGVRSSALMFPIYMYGFIWKGKQDRELNLSTGMTKITEIRIPKTTDMDLWKISSFFARNARPCLQYGSHELMTADIHDMLEILQLLPCKRGACLKCEVCLRVTKGDPDLDLYKALQVDIRPKEAEKQKFDLFKYFRQHDEDRAL